MYVFTVLTVAVTLVLWTYFAIAPLTSMTRHSQHRFSTVLSPRQSHNNLQTSVQ